MRGSSLPTWSQQPVSTLGRILAATLLALFALGFVGLTVAVITDGVGSLRIASGSLLGAIYVFPFLYSMAFKGQYPRHWLPWK
jgi:hypothetical protein